MKADSKVVFEAFQLKYENLNRKNFRPASGASIHPDDVVDETLSAAAMPIQTEKCGENFEYFGKNFLREFDWIYPYSQGRDIVWESMND